VDLLELTRMVKEAEGFEKLGPKSVARVLTNLTLYKDVRRDGHNGARRFGFRFSELAEAEARLVGKRQSGNTTDVTDATDGADARLDAPKQSPPDVDAPSGPQPASVSWSVSSAESVSSVAPEHGQPSGAVSEEAAKT
jgi:hypothetical protein